MTTSVSTATKIVFSGLACSATAGSPLSTGATHYLSRQTDNDDDEIIERAKK